MSSIVSETISMKSSSNNAMRRASRLFASSGGISFRAGTDVNLIVIKISDFENSLNQDALSIFTDNDEFRKPLMMAPSLRDNAIHTKLLNEIANLPFFSSLPYSVTSRVSRLFMYQVFSFFICLYIQTFAPFHTIFNQNSSCDKFYLSFIFIYFPSLFLVLRGCVAIHCNKKSLPFENVESEENKIGDCIAIISRNDFMGDLNIYHERYRHGSIYKF